MLTTKASVFKRSIAFIFDVGLSLLIGLLLQILVATPIANNSFDYQTNQDNLLLERVKSGLFYFYDGNDVVSYLDAEDKILSSNNDNDSSLYNLQNLVYLKDDDNYDNQFYLTGLDYFFSLYNSEYPDDIFYQDVKDSSSLFKDGELIEGYEESELLTFLDSVFNRISPYFERLNDNAIPNLSMSISVTRIVITISSYGIPLTIFYLIVPLCNKNRKTFGKMIMNLGVVNKYYVRASILQTITRGLSFIILEMLLSLMLLGLPLVISFLIVYFNRDGKSLHDLISFTMVLDLKEFTPFDNIEEYNKFIKDEKDVRDRSLRRLYE